MSTNGKPDLAHRIQDAMSALGSTRAGVAGTLAVGRYRGTRHDGHRCPVARFLKRRIGESLFVTTSAVRRGADSAFICKPPTCVARFVAAFDDGEYPWMEEDDDRRLPRPRA